ncbi:hypothetical protein [Bradyrhizobium sp. F1.13.3]|uniref:hypothetical protein n=1 Tax=Bradyrhizobium sp. F1.13.3 TaxID=3156351 RepID=UPI003391C191
MILNEEELENKRSETFAKYSKKVIDSSLVFAPTPVDSAEIAIKGPAPHMRQLADCGIKLGIANIRILKRLERFVSMVETSMRRRAKPARLRFLLRGCGKCQGVQEPICARFSNLRG